MARVIEQNVPDVKATARVTAATTENTRLLGQDKIEFALAAASGPYAAAQGLSPFEGEVYDNVRYIATGYSSPFQIIVEADSPIKSISDFADKRIGVLVGITAQEWFPRVAEVYGVKGKFEEFQLRAAELMTSLRDGNIDAAVYSGAAPTSAVTDLATAKSVRFLPIEESKAKEVMKTHPFFFIDSLKAGTYPGLDSSVTTLFNPILMVTRAGVSEDLVYQVTKALLETNRDDFTAIHPNAAQFSVENAGKSMVVPVHPGAAKFYAEKGVTLN
jgi:TRAP transporter TAXI family solute receptor